MATETADLVFAYNIEHIAEIFEEDKKLKSVLASYGLYISDITLEEINPERTELYKTLAELLLDNNKTIANAEIADLWSYRFIVSPINNVFGQENVVDWPLYQQIIFSYKYSTIKHFFRDNFIKFLPPLDASVIEDSDQMTIFQKAFMHEYDRFADIIDKICNITDIDKVENEYLSYLVQLLGYEKGDDSILGTDSFRELSKNIVEVYKIKGTNYSFELFFNFLGFEVTLEEFWFDKRFADEGIEINPYTGVDDPTQFSYYLTPIKPTDYIPDNMNEEHAINEDKLTDIRSHLWWAKKLELGATVEQLLNNDPENPPEEGFNYEYFKTNIIQYSIERISSKETDADELSAEDEKIIQAYADFLTPIFISKQILITINPFEDSAEAIFSSDGSLVGAWGNHISMFQAKAEYFIVDELDAVYTERHNPTEETEHGIDDEAPRELFIMIKTLDYDEVLGTADKDFTKSNMTQIMDDDSYTDTEFGSMDYFHVHAVKSRSEITVDDSALTTMWELMTDDTEFNKEYFHSLFPHDDPDNALYAIQGGLAKILNFEESIFNRIHRLEDLNVMTRDWVDWEDFSTVRAIPTFADAVDAEMGIEQFWEEEIDGETVLFNEGDDVTLTPWWYYDTLNIKRTTYSWIGFGFAKTNATVTGQIEVVRVGGYPPGTTTGYADPISLDGSIDNEWEVVVKPVHLGKIKTSGKDIVAPAKFDNGNDYASLKFNAPDIVAEELHVAFIKEYAKLMLFGIYQFDEDTSGATIEELEAQTTADFYTLFISSNKNVWALVEDGGFVSNGSADHTLVFERECTEAVGIFTDEADYTLVFSREAESEPLAQTSGTSDVLVDDFIFPNIADYASLDTTTPYIRGENEGFIYPNVASYVEALMSGTSYESVLYAAVNDYALGILSEDDIKAVLVNLAFVSDNAVQVTVDYETDNNGIIVNPIFIVDNPLELQILLTDTLAHIGYTLEAVVSALELSGTSTAYNVQELVIEVAEIIIAELTTAFTLDLTFVTELQEKVLSGELAAAFELIREVELSGPMVLGGTRETYLYLESTILINSMTLTYSEKLTEFLLVRDVDVTEMILSAEDWEHLWVIERTGLPNIADPTIFKTADSVITVIQEADNEADIPEIVDNTIQFYTDYTEPNLGGSIDLTDSIISDGLFIEREADGSTPIDLYIEYILADTLIYDYVADDAGLEWGSLVMSDEEYPELEFVREMSGSIVMSEDDIIGTVDAIAILEGQITMSNDGVDDDYADYTEPTLGGVIELYGTSDENVKIYKYIATVEDGIALTYTDDMVADTYTYDYVGDDAGLEWGSFILTDETISDGIDFTGDNVTVEPSTLSGKITELDEVNTIDEVTGSITISEDDIIAPVDSVATLSGQITMSGEITEFDDGYYEESTLEYGSITLTDEVISDSIDFVADTTLEWGIGTMSGEEIGIVDVLSTPEYGSVLIDDNIVSATQVVTYDVSTVVVTAVETSDDTDFVIERIGESETLFTSGPETPYEAYYNFSVEGDGSVVLTDEIISDCIDFSMEGKGEALSLGGAGVIENDVQYDFLGQSASLAYMYSAGEAELDFIIERTTDGGLTLADDATGESYFERISDTLVIGLTSDDTYGTLDFIREGDGSATMGEDDIITDGLDVNSVSEYGSVGMSEDDITSDYIDYTDPTVEGSITLTSGDFVEEGNIFYFEEGTESIGYLVVSGAEDGVFELERIGDYPEALTSGDGGWLFEIDRDMSGEVVMTPITVDPDSATTT